MTLIRSKIVGHGHAVPAKVLTNDDLSKIVDTNDEWIRTRTGILSRHVVENELTSDLAYDAAKMALKTAGLSGSDVDLVVVATVTPDNTTPSVASKVSAKLDVKYGTPAYDISAACSGFVYALTQADNMIRLGQIKTAVVIGAETLSKLTDWTDRNTCVLFGDGAGAVVLTASTDDSGILATKIYADGTKFDKLKTTGGVSSTKTVGFIEMDGKEVFRNAIPSLAQAAETVIEMAGLTKDDVDWLIPHQANIRIIEGVGQKMDLPEEKVIVNLQHWGNTSAATIPIAFSENMEKGTIKKGDLVVMTAMGAGFTWGAAIVRI